MAFQNTMSFLSPNGEHLPRSVCPILDSWGENNLAKFGVTHTSWKKISSLFSSSDCFPIMKRNKVFFEDFFRGFLTPPCRWIFFASPAAKRILAFKTKFLRKTTFFLQFELPFSTMHIPGTVRPTGLPQFVVNHTSILAKSSVGFCTFAANDRLILGF